MIRLLAWRVVHLLVFVGCLGVMLVARGASAPVSLTTLASVSPQAEVHIPPQLIKYLVIDDHTALLQTGIPSLVVIDVDHPHLNTTNNTSAKVRAARWELVGSTVERWLETRAQL